MAQQQQPNEGSDHAAAHNEATSRLCVKNIPKYLDEKRLKEHFSAKGQVTDVKILKTRWVVFALIPFVDLPYPQHRHVVSCLCAQTPLEQDLSGLFATSS